MANAAINSCLYKAKVMHHRLAPKVHRFNYEVFMFYLDLDEIDSLSKRLKFMSRNRFNFSIFGIRITYNYRGKTLILQKISVSILPIIAKQWCNHRQRAHYGADQFVYRRLPV